MIYNKIEIALKSGVTFLAMGPGNIQLQNKIQSFNGRTIMWNQNKKIIKSASSLRFSDVKIE